MTEQWGGASPLRVVVLGNHRPVVPAGPALVSVALSVCLSGCAATLTTAWGEDAAARLFAPPGASCEAAPAQGAAGSRTTVVEDREGKLGPDDVVTTTTTEPAFAPAAAPKPLAEALGSKVSETGGGVIRTALGFLGGVAKGLFGLFVP